MAVCVYLGVVGPQDDPATEAVAQVDGCGAAAEPDDVRERRSECHNQDLRWEEGERGGREEGGDREEGRRGRQGGDREEGGGGRRKGIEERKKGGQRRE